MRPEFLDEVLDKFAVSGGMYARALGGAAQRAGGRVAPQILNQVAAQPRAQGSSFLSEQARTPGAVAASPEQQSAQALMRTVPYAGSEHGGSSAAPKILDRMLAATGRTTQAPGTNAAIRQQFGDPLEHRRTGAPTNMQFDPTHASRSTWLAGQGLPQGAGAATHVDPISAFEPTMNVNRPAVGQQTPTGTVVRRKVAMLKHAYSNGATAAFDRYGLKDAGLREKLMPLALAAGIGGGGTAAMAGAKHLMHPHHNMPVQQSVQQEMPNFQGALGHHLSQLDAAATAR